MHRFIFQTATSFRQGYFSLFNLPPLSYLFGFLTCTPGAGQWSAGGSWVWIWWSAWTFQWVCMFPCSCMGFSQVLQLPPIILKLALVILNCLCMWIVVSLNRNSGPVIDLQPVQSKEKGCMDEYLSHYKIVCHSNRITCNVTCKRLCER